MNKLAMCLLGFLLSFSAHAELRLAVAANFAETLEVLVADYRADNSDAITVVRGSSGKLYAQIAQGAPFDIFFSADADRPATLESRGLVIPGSRKAYALGTLVLWPAGAEPEKTLRDFPYTRFSIANPRLAPYGKAAQEVLMTLGIADRAQAHLVRGENISQAYQYVYSGNAQAGLLARSQMSNGDDFWVVPNHWYSPIEQQRVILKNSQQPDRAKQFLQFMQTPRAQQRLLDAGYQLPEAL